MINEIARWQVHTVMGRVVAVMFKGGRVMYRHGRTNIWRTLGEFETKEAAFAELIAEFGDGNVWEEK